MESLITNCSNIATSLLNIATSCVFTKDVAMLSRDVAMLVLTLLDVKSLSRLKKEYFRKLVTDPFIYKLAT